MIPSVGGTGSPVDDMPCTDGRRRIRGIVLLQFHQRSRQERHPEFHCRLSHRSLYQPEHEGGPAAFTAGAIATI